MSWNFYTVAKLWKMKAIELFHQSKDSSLHNWFLLDNFSMLVLDLWTILIIYPLLFYFFINRLFMFIFLNNFFWNIFLDRVWYKRNVFSVYFLNLKKILKTSIMGSILAIKRVSTFSNWIVTKTIFCVQSAWVLL